MLSLFAAAALGAAAHCGYEGETQVTGLARDPRSGALMYCEYFLPTENQSTRVLYYSPQGFRIAEKILFTGETEPARNSPRPEVLQRDYRLGEEREVRNRDGQWQMRYRASAAADWESALVGQTTIDVIDAGFDAFVRKNWESLLAGDRLEFNFASPIHGRAIALRARKVNCRGNETGKVCLRVDLAQPLLRFFAGDLYLEYSADSRRLQFFEGVVNLLDEQGQNQRLQIDYRYD
ncbi:hypothetical protein SAMN04487965_0522 [Microbulbifer donghaiensis]|uniref:DUF3108 domain-containing protein n=1 Tax=Microbulbifer donghaiensis TaxID=494016 RepID=A0A1M4VV06_9GAMM|nr:hypothetical protein [Microbulbifer donghaiensis]SHE72740.1 hypothetical protein SAMN04487965_0522 [Microbulbifer donghaiensis]